MFATFSLSAGRRLATRTSSSISASAVLEDYSEKRNVMKACWWHSKVVKSKAISTYQVMDEDGVITNQAEFPSELSKETILQCYQGMVKLNTFDRIMYEVQRQGAISFYMTNFGEEGVHFGSALALDLEDVVFAQYREAGVLMHRGFTIQQMAHQLYSNKHDIGKGRQMPVHYGSKDLNFQTISSPLATQIPQAAGAAYALKVTGKKAVTVCYFGDGAASEGDFHAALNFAATLGAPVIFICRNNKWAISTPTREQYRGDGIASRGPGYGIDTIRVDGNDFFGVYNTVKEAKRYILDILLCTLHFYAHFSFSFVLRNNKPVLIEAMTYRVGHHSTSDDSNRYREKTEVASWLTGNNPISRLAKWLVVQGWWDEEKDNTYKKECFDAVVAAKAVAESEKKPKIENIFNDVYDELTPDLLQQQKELLEHLKKYGDKYPLDLYEPKQ